MATATEKRYTPDDLLAIDDRPPPDLVDGQFEERESVGYEEAEIAISIASILRAFTKTCLPARVTGADGGLRIFPDDPNRVRFPDVSLTRRNRFPSGKRIGGHSTVVPDLVVEVVSPNDNVGRLQRKIRDYRAAGVPMIWVVHPETRDVDVIRNDGTSVQLTETQTIDGGDVLPGFQCAVASFFE